MSVTARVCCITGGATGIGAACVRAFAAQRWRVVFSFMGDEQAPHARQLADECGATAQPLDVRDDTSCHVFVNAASAAHGRIDALVHGAAVTRFVPHADLDAMGADEFLRTLDVNTVGAWRMLRAAQPLLSASGRGSVVLISSIGGMLGRGSSLAYAASKGALNTLTLGLARALAPAVRVNAIAPGFVDGGLPSRVLGDEQLAAVRALQTEAAPLKRVAQPAEVAALALFLVTQAPAMTGNVIAMDNGLHLNAG